MDEQITRFVHCKIPLKWAISPFRSILEPIWNPYGEQNIPLGKQRSLMAGQAKILTQKEISDIYSLPVVALETTSK
ncbi:MAG: hypothetical protein K8F91_09470 [Candidatus Obscuribacterales bacterium]|nr:hypothetical protein [Candidatus Obscuribacterales bacterium]